MNYLETIDRINEILREAQEFDTIKLINNAKIRGGGSSGEVLAIICSLLKVYEKKFPQIFSLIKKEAKILYAISKQIGMKIKPNFDLLEDLDWE